MQTAKIFENYVNLSCWFHWSSHCVHSDEYPYQGFSHFPAFFASFCFGKSTHQQHTVNRREKKMIGTYQARPEGELPCFYPHKITFLDLCTCRNKTFPCYNINAQQTKRSENKKINKQEIRRKTVGPFIIMLLFVWDIFFTAHSIRKVLWTPYSFFFEVLKFSLYSSAEGYLRIQVLKLNQIQSRIFIWSMLFWRYHGECDKKSQQKIPVIQYCILCKFCTCI